MRYRRLSYRYVIERQDEPVCPQDVLRGSRPGVAVCSTWWRPSTDVYETPTALMLSIELAAVDPDALEILLYDDAVVITGQRLPFRGQSGGVYHSAEIQHGPFRLELEIPVPIDADRVEARYDAGLLQVILPKPAGGS